MTRSLSKHNLVISAGWCVFKLKKQIFLFTKAVMLVFALEQFSIECRKTKTKVITQANHSGRRQSNKPIKARSKYKKPGAKRGKTREGKLRFVLVLLPTG